MNTKMSTKILASILLFLFFASCSYTLKIKDGRTAYDRKQFATAVPMLEKEYASAKTRKEKGQLAYLLGDSYRKMGQDEKSLSWFEAAYANNFGPEALKAQALTLKKLERYPAAREVFKNLGIEIGSPYEYRKDITACTVAEGWLGERPGNGWSIEIAPFNSPQNDFAPSYFYDGRLVFTSDRSMVSGKKPTAGRAINSWIFSLPIRVAQAHKHLIVNGIPRATKARPVSTKWVLRLFLFVR